MKAPVLISDWIQFNLNDSTLSSLLVLPMTSNVVHQCTVTAVRMPNFLSPEWISESNWIVVNWLIMIVFRTLRNNQNQIISFEDKISNHNKILLKWNHVALCVMFKCTNPSKCSHCENRFCTKILTFHRFVTLLFVVVSSVSIAVKLSTQNHFRYFIKL